MDKEFFDFEPNTDEISKMSTPNTPIDIETHVSSINSMFQGYMNSKNYKSE